MQPSKEVYMAQERRYKTIALREETAKALEEVKKDLAKHSPIPMRASYSDLVDYLIGFDKAQKKEVKHGKENLRS